MLYHGGHAVEPDRVEGAVNRVCSVCLAFLGYAPGPADAVTHGFCRRHELEALVKAKVATPAEAEELRRLEEWARLGGAA